DPTPTRARLLAALAAAHDPSLEWQTRRDLSVEAVDVARRAGDDATFVQVLDISLFALASPDDRDQRVADLSLATTIADQLDDPPLRARLAEQSMWVRYQQADALGANAIFAELKALSEIVGLPFQRWRVELFETGRALLAGDAAEAEAANE